ncbi:GNAT family N-acetyltransferase [Stetteria hydrogenophila]
METGVRESREFIIRRAREDDIYQVIEVNMASLPERYWFGFYLTLLRNWGEAFLVAEADGRVVGYAMSRVEETRDPVLLGLKSELEPASRPPESRGLLSKIAGGLYGFLASSRPVGHLVSIAVMPAYRRRGIGKALLSETIRVMRDVYKVDAIYLEVRVSNKPAISLYEKLGFRKVRIAHAYYADGEDAYIMVKRLREEAGALEGSEGEATT